MTYEAWRISYQSSEQAARAAYEECMRLRAELTDLRNSMAFRTSLIGRTEAERDALQAKITEMEQQEPVAEIGQQYTLLFVGSGSMTELVKRHGIKIGTKLYALPGAQTQGE